MTGYEFSFCVMGGLKQKPASWNPNVMIFISLMISRGNPGISAVESSRCTISGLKCLGFTGGFGGSWISVVLFFFRFSTFQFCWGVI